MSKANISIEVVRPLQGLTAAIDAALTRLERAVALAEKPMREYESDLCRWGDDGGYTP